MNFFQNLIAILLKVLNGYAFGNVVAKVPTSVYSLNYDLLRNHLFIGQNFDGLHVIDLISKREITSLQITKSNILISSLMLILFMWRLEMVLFILSIEKVGGL